MVRGELLGRTSTEGASREWGVGEGYLKKDEEEQTRFPREPRDLSGKGGSQY